MQQWQCASSVPCCQHTTRTKREGIPVGRMHRLRELQCVSVCSLMLL